MTLLSSEEFNQQSTPGTNSLEKIYQEKAIEAGPIFSLNNLQAAELYCESFSRKKNNALCIIVEEKSFLKIWSEISRNRQNISSNPRSSTEKITEKTETFIDLPITDEFTTYCRNLLAEYLGPIAKIICKKTLAKKPGINRIEFVAALAKKISDPIQAQEFEKLALK